MRLRLLIFIFFLSINSFCQELPPIVKYNSSTYNAGNQNWMISQDKNHYVYFANNEGLLEFNGSNWTLYKSPNETIIRSVNVIGNKIFTGCYMEFGFWNRQNNGRLTYTSLSKKIKSKILDDEQFWNIINYDQWVIFQSLSRIYIYDTKTSLFKIIIPKNNILKSFKTSNSIYYQTANDGLYEIENGKSKLVTNNSIIKNNKIVNIFSIDEGLLIHTQFNGFFKLIDGNLTKFNTEADSEIAASSIYSSQMLSDSSFAIGTISNGVFILTKEGKVNYHITQNKGLSNNTVLSLFEDIDKNLWIGLDNGINCINLQSPVRSFSDDTGILGTVYTSKLHNNKLYIGTNQGLFYKNYLNGNQFKYISGTKGQVWSLFVHDGTLFCGHDSGTFIIENEIAKQIFSQSGTWKFETSPINRNRIIQGNYYGLSVLEKINNQWQFRNKITGFDYSSRYFEITNNNEVYVSHEYKGVFRFFLDSKNTKASNLYTYTNPTKGKNAGLVTFNNTIYYAYKEGIFKLNKKTKQFEKDKSLSSVFDNEEYTSGKMVLDNSNKLWLFSKNYINYFTLNKLSSDLKKNSIPIPSSLTNSMLGYENITQLSNSNYLIGTTDGYYTININDLSFKNYSVSISDISINKLNEKLTSFSITEEGKFKYDENNVTFTYTVPEYNKYINAEYQYLLEGFQDEWSEWSAKPTVNFKNLPSGDYIFKVRARIASSTPENIAVYSFTIKKPWYATNFALVLYMVLLVYMFLYINKLYKNYYQKQREKLIEENNLLLEIKELENEQQLMKIRNEQLSQDVDAKNKELAVSTMSLIKKDELLSVIKEDLKKSSDENSSRSIKSVISTITRNISEEDTWNVFKEAFDTADKDFLKKVKAAHSSLTPNDLRLCAYLRLNLSSKEIAPLLNISVRSVEIKRYRLRKKMDLSHEQGLVEYILSI
ncbi:MAG: triple tyrosine motif-containing protein [Flavobacterium sp.]|uniref:helix-turn-helix and ligand-binding sensor domain-containing protein n=1 Tax=Flavobacterium sp. TaxID=239 RepID=UPI0022C2105C|nr:triple tyrosine motif-containing protein [Flavobacterium sp.]MCZ8197640.1 triple tyrosine motif-containing protein [Flavobacterium sp.]